MKKFIKHLLKLVIPYFLQRKFHKNTSLRYFFQRNNLADKIPNTISENKFLSSKNPEYLKIYDNYYNIRSDHSFWIDWFDDSDFKNFKGENVFVTQLTGLKSIAKAYENTVNYAISIDSLGLNTIFDEDRKFGVETVIVNGNYYSRDRIDSIIEINYISRLLGYNYNSELRILDIGAGYGRLASRLLQAFPKSYVYCGDVVPQASFLCNFYLNFKGFNNSQFKCGSYNDLIQEGNFDIAVNIHSFSEAPLESIKRWLDIINIKAKYIYIVPSGNGLLSMEKDGSRVEYKKYIENLGFTLVDKSNKYGDLVIDKNLYLSPAFYYLFKKVT